MPTDLDRLYSALGQDASTIPLPSSESLRRRADRRARTATVVFCTLVFLIISGTAFGAHHRFARPSSAPAGADGPSPRTSASASPSPTASESPETPAKLIPARAFVVPSASAGLRQLEAPTGEHF